MDEIKDIPSLLKSIYSYYDPDNTFDDSFFEDVAKKYEGREEEIIKEVYNYYDPDSGFDDNFFKQVADKYRKPATTIVPPTTQEQVDFTKPLEAAKIIPARKPQDEDEQLLEIADKYGYGKLNIDELIDQATEAVRSGDEGSISAFGSGIDQVRSSIQAGIKSLKDTARSERAALGGIPTRGGRVAPYSPEKQAELRQIDNELKLLESKGYFEKGGAYEKAVYRSLVGNKKFRTALETKGLDPDATLAEALRGETEGFWTRLGMSIAQTAPQLAGQIGAGVVGGVLAGPVGAATAGGAFMGSQVYGGRILEGLVDDQKITDEDRIAAMGSAIVEFGAESLLGPVGKVGGKIVKFISKKGVDIAEDAIKKGGARQLLDFTVNLFKKGIAEGAEETLVTAVTPINEAIAKQLSQEDPNFDFREYLKEEYGDEGLTDEMIESFLVGFGTGAPTAIMDLAQPKAKPKEEAPPTETEFIPEAELTPEQTQLAVNVRTFLNDYQGDTENIDTLYNDYLATLTEDEQDLAKNKEAQIKDVLSIVLDERKIERELAEEVPTEQVTEEVPEQVPTEEATPTVNRDAVVQEIEDNLSPTARETEGFDRVSLEEYVQRRIDEGLTTTEIKERVKEDFAEAIGEGYTVDDISKVEFDRVMRGEQPQQTTIDRLAGKVNDPNLTEREKAVLDKIRETPETFAKVEETSLRSKIKQFTEPIVQSLTANQTEDVKEVARNEISSTIVQGRKDGKDLDTIFEEIANEYKDLADPDALAPLIKEAKNKMYAAEARDVLDTGNKSSLLSDTANNQLLEARQILETGTEEQKQAASKVINESLDKGTDLTQVLPYINNPAALNRIQEGNTKKVDQSQVNNVAARLADEILPSNSDATFDQIKQDVAEAVDAGITENALVQKIYDKYKVAKPVADSNIFKITQETVESEGSIEFDIDELGAVADDERNGVRFFFNKLMENAVISAAMAADPNAKSDLATLPKLIRAFGRYLTGKKVVIHKDRKALENYIEANQLNITLPKAKIGGFMFKDSIHILASEANNKTTTHEFLHVFFRDLLTNNQEYAKALIDKLKNIEGFQKIYKKVQEQYAEVYSLPSQFLEEALVTFFQDVATKPLKVQRSIFEKVIDAINSILKAAGIDWKIENVNVADFAFGLQAAIQGGYLIERRGGTVNQTPDTATSMQVDSPQALPMMINQFLQANPGVLDNMDGLIKIKSLEALRSSDPLDTIEKRLAYANAILDVIKTAANAFFNNDPKAQVFEELGEYVLNAVQTYIQNTADPIIPESVVKFAEIYYEYKNQGSTYPQLANMDTAFGAANPNVFQSDTNLDAFYDGLLFVNPSIFNIVEKLSDGGVFIAYADTPIDQGLNEGDLDLTNNVVLVSGSNVTTSSQGNKIVVRMAKPLVIGDDYELRENKQPYAITNYEVDDFIDQAVDNVAERLGVTKNEAKFNYYDEVLKEAAKLKNTNSKAFDALENARVKHQPNYDPNSKDEVSTAELLHEVDGKRYVDNYALYNIIKNNPEAFGGKEAATKVLIEVYKTLGYDGIIFTPNKSYFTGSAQNDAVIIPFDNTQMRTQYGEEVIQKGNTLEYNKYEYKVSKSGQAVDKMNISTKEKNSSVYNALPLEGRVLEYQPDGSNQTYNELKNKGINIVQFANNISNKSYRMPEFTNSSEIMEKFDNIIGIGLELKNESDIPQVIQHMFDLLKIGGTAYLNLDGALNNNALNYANSLLKEGALVNSENIQGAKVVKITKKGLTNDAPVFQIIGAKGLQSKLSAARQITGDPKSPQVLEVKENIRNLRLAQTMRSLSIHPKIIKAATGWEFTVFNSWNKAVSPVKLKTSTSELMITKGINEAFNKKQVQGKVKLSNIIEPYDDIFMLYPKLKDVEVGFLKSEGGQWSGKDNKISLGVNQEVDNEKEVENLPYFKELIDKDPNQYNSGVKNLYQYVVEDAYNNYSVENLFNNLSLNDRVDVRLYLDQINVTGKPLEELIHKGYIGFNYDILKVVYILRKQGKTLQEVHEFIKYCINNNIFSPSANTPYYLPFKEDTKGIFKKTDNNQDSFLFQMFKEFFNYRVNKVLVHEVQHAIQFYEGWYNGGSPASADFFMGNVRDILSKTGIFYKAKKRLDDINNLEKNIKSTYKTIADLKAKGGLSSIIKIKNEEQYLKDLQDKLVDLKQSDIIEEGKPKDIQANLFSEMLGFSTATPYLMTINYPDLINNKAFKKYYEQKIYKAPATQEQYEDFVRTTFSSASWEVYRLLGGEVQSATAEMLLSDVYANLLIDDMADLAIADDLKIDSENGLAKDSIIKDKLLTKVVKKTPTATVNITEYKRRAALPYEGNIRPGGVATLSADFSKKMEIDTLIEVSNKLGELFPQEFTPVMHLAKLAARIIDDPSPININSLSEYLEVYTIKDDDQLKKAMTKASKEDESINFNNLSSRITNIPRSGINQETARRIYELVIGNAIKTYNTYTGSTEELNTTDPNQPMFQISSDVHNMDAVDKVVAVDLIGLDDRVFAPKTKIGKAEFRKALGVIYNDTYNMSYATLARVNAILSTSHPKERQQEFTAITDAIDASIGALKDKSDQSAVNAAKLIRSIPVNKIDDWQFQTLIDGMNFGTPTEQMLYKFIEKSFEFFSDPVRNDDSPVFQLSDEQFEEIENEKRKQRKTTSRERAIANYIKTKDADPKVSDIQIMEGLMNAYGMKDIEARRELEFVLKRKYIPVPTNFTTNYRKTLAKAKAFRWKAFRNKVKDANRWYTFHMQDDNEIVRKTEEALADQIAMIRAAQEVAAKYGLTMQRDVSAGQQAMELYPKEVNKLKKKYAKEVNIYEEVESPWATKVTANGRVVFFESEVMEKLFGGKPGEIGAKGKINKSMLGRANNAGISYESLNEFLFYRHLPEFLDRKNELIRQVRDALMNQMLDIQTQMVQNADDHKAKMQQLRDRRNLATTQDEKNKINDQIDKQLNRYNDKANALKAKVDQLQNELDKRYNQFIYNLGFDNNAKNPTAITKQYAQDKLTELVAKHPEIEKYADEIRDFLLNGYLDIIEAEGLMDVERLVALRNGTDSKTNVDWKYYIPMRVKDDVAKDMVYDYNTMFGDMGMPGVYGLEGGGGRDYGKQDRFDPIAQMFINIVAVKNVAERNNSIRTFADFIKRLKISGFGVASANDRLVTINSALELDDNLNKIKPGLKLETAETKNAPEYIEDGKLYKIVALNNKTRTSLLYQSYQSDSPINIDGNTFGRFYNWYLNFSRTLITSANLAFGFNQVIPDALEGGINSSIDVSVQTKVNKTKLAKSFANNWRKSLQFFIGSAFQTLYSGQPKGEVAQAYIDFQKYGGKMSWRRISGDNLKQYNEITKLIEDADKGVSIPVAGARKIISAIMNSTDGMENMARFAAFLTAKQYGLDNIRAAAVAKESTLNFEAKGRSTLYKVAKMLYLFVGPALKSPQRAARTLFYGGGKLMMGAITAAALNRMLLHLLTDDEDELDRKLNNAYANQNRFTIPIFVEGKPDISVKLPYGWLRIANSIGIGVVDTMYGKREQSDIVSDVMAGFLGLFDPVSGSASLTNLIPTQPLKAALQVAVNKDYASRNIVSPFIIERADFRKDEFDRGTSVAYIQFAEWLNSKGLGDVSPANMQYVLEQTILYPGITKPLEFIDEASKALIDLRPSDEFVKLFEGDFEPKEEIDVNKLLWFTTAFYKPSDEDISDLINFFELDKKENYVAPFVRTKLTYDQYQYYIRVYNKLYKNEMVSKQALNQRIKSWQNKFPEDDKGNKLNWEKYIEINKRRDKLLKEK